MGQLRKAIIVAAKRTALGKIGGLHRFRALESLALHPMSQVLRDAKIERHVVDEIIMGNAAGGGGNPARLCALAAKFPYEIPAFTVDRQCSSGLDAIVLGARLIETGAAEVVLAGGAESPSTAPWRIKKPRNPYTDLPVFYAQAQFAPFEIGDPTMTESAEALARHYGISKERQDALILQSHAKAAKAASATLSEIVHFEATDADELIRPNLTAKLLQRLPPLYKQGTVTAASAASPADGAAFVLLVSDRYYEQNGFTKGLMVINAASAGVDPKLSGTGAIAATQRLWAKSNLKADNFARIEIVEAFASQVIATMDSLSLDTSLTNPQGGAFAFGHAFGASGAILVVRLFTAYFLSNTLQKGQRFLAMAASAGGLGVCAAFEAV